MTVRRVLIVCTGNTCRSPMAAVLLRQAWQDSGAPWDLVVRSAGTNAVDGDPASPHARAAIKARGLSLEEHGAQGLLARFIAEADLILTMTLRHKDYLLNRWPDAAAKVYTLGEFASTGSDVADPYGGVLKDYEATVADLDRLLQGVVTRIRREGTAAP